MRPFWHWAFLFATCNASDSWVSLCIVQRRKYMIFLKEGGTERVCFCFLRIRKDKFCEVHPLWSTLMNTESGSAHLWIVIHHQPENEKETICIVKFHSWDAQRYENKHVKMKMHVSYDKTSIWWGSGLLLLSINHWHFCWNCSINYKLLNSIPNLWCGSHSPFGCY